jgi:hypothetical protein
MTTKRRIGVEVEGRTTDRGRLTADRKRYCRKEKMRRGGRARSDLELYMLEISFRVDSPSCAVQPRNGAVVGAHLGRASQERKIDTRSMIRLVERTAVGEGR